MKKLLFLIFISCFLAPAQVCAKSTVANLPPEAIGFTGKLDNHTPPLFLNPNDFTSLKNLRYFENGIGTRSGMTLWSTDTEGEEVVSIFPFEHEGDGLHVITACINAGTGITYYLVEDQEFGSTALWQTDGTTAYPVTKATVRDSLVVGDESGASIWSGTSCVPMTLLVEDSEGNLTDRSDWIHSGASKHVASGDVWYVGYSRPFDAVQADENSGTWDTGFESSVTPELKGEFFRYWASCTCTSGGSFFQTPRIKTTPRPLTSLWDGTWQYAGAFIVEPSGASEYQDYSLLVADASEESYADIGGFDSGGTIAVGFFNKPRNVRIRLPEDYKNGTASVLSFHYWNGSSIKAISGTTVDGTSHDGAAFAQAGVWTLPRLTDWEPRTYGESELSLYYLFAYTSAEIDDYTRVYSCLAVPEVDDPNEDNYKGVLEYKDRVFLYNGDDLNLVLMSAYNQPDTYVGEDAFSEVEQFRIGKREKTIMAAPSPDGVLWFKKTENFFMPGRTPAEIGLNIQKLPRTAPCVAPESVVLVEGESGYFWIYQSYDGFYAIDAAGNNPLLSKDIQAYFTDGDDLEISEAWLDQTRAFFDRKENEYRAFIAAGSGATEFTEQAVYDLDVGKWTTFDVNDLVQLSCGAAIDEDEYLRLAGGYDGYLYKLESTGNDAGYDIISDFTRPPYILRGGVGQDQIRGRSAVGKQELRAIAFNFKLPDEAAISGCSLYLTPGIASSDTTYQEGFNLTTDGWRSSALDPDWEKKGYYHTIRFRVPGRIEFYRQIMWSREAPWELSLNLDLLIDENGNILQTETNHLLRG